MIGGGRRLYPNSKETSIPTIEPFLSAENQFNNNFGKLLVFKRVAFLGAKKKTFEKVENVWFHLTRNYFFFLF